LTSRRKSNPLPSAEQYGTQTIVKAIDELKYQQCASTAEQYSAQSLLKAFDELKYEQCAAIS